METKNGSKGALEDATVAVLERAHRLLTATAKNSVIAQEEDVLSVRVRLPDGMPGTLVIPDDWEERAGFIADIGGNNNSGEAARASIGCSTLATSAVARDGMVESREHEDEYRDDEEEEGGDDPRNHSMWAVVPDDEDLDEEDDDFVSAYEKIKIGASLGQNEGAAFDTVSPPVSQSTMSCEIRSDDRDNDDVVDEFVFKDDARIGFDASSDEKNASNEAPAVKIVDSANKGGNDFDEDDDRYANLGATPNKKRDESLDPFEGGDKVMHLFGIEGTAFDGDGYPSSKKTAAGPSRKPAPDKNETDAETPPEKREPKGRILLVRIKRKITPGRGWKKAMKKMFSFRKSSRKHAANYDDDEGGEIITDVRVLVPPCENGVPPSPSSMSVISVHSSISVSSNGKIIGAVPVKSGLPPPSSSADLLYGAIRYNDGGRSFDESTVGGSDDLPPPPPMNLSLPMRETMSSDEEDAISFLAEAMKSMSNDEGSALLLAFTPRNGNGEVVTPTHNSENGDVEEGVILGATGASHRTLTRDSENGDGEENHRIPSADDSATHGGSAVDARSPNLASLFANKEGTPIQIMDAVEVEGGYLLTPTGEECRSNAHADIFRYSTSSEASVSILPGSVINSDEEDIEEEGEGDEGTPILNDDCMSTQETETFCDHTISTMESGGARLSVDVQTLPRQEFTDDCGKASPYSFASTLPSASSPSNVSIELSAVKPSTGAAVAKAAISSTKKKSPKRKKQSPKKSTLSNTRSRSGLVKSRVSDIHQRIERLASSSDDASSVMSSYRSGRNNGNGKTFPKVSSQFIRTVPIGIAKTYSQDGGHSPSSSSVGGGGSVGGMRRLSCAYSFEHGYQKQQRKCQQQGSGEDDGSSSYANKYTDSLGV